MSLLMLEGFDDNLYRERHRSPSGGTVSASYGYNGKGLRAGDTPSDGTFWHQPDTTNPTLTAGMMVKIINRGSGDGYVFVFGDDTYADRYNIRIIYDQSNSRWYINDRTTAYTTPNNSAFLDTWYYLELKCTWGDGTAGSWEFRVDGSTLLSATGVDTAYAPSDGYHTMVMFSTDGSNWVDDFYIDDVYLTDGSGSDNTSFLGITEVATLLPSGNGTNSDMVGSDADSTDNYLLVDNNASVPLVTTEYVESGAEGDTDTYGMDDVSGSPVVNGLIGTLYADKDDQDAKYMRTVVLSGATRSNGTSFPLSNGTFAAIDEIYETDPNTGIQWLYGDVNAMEFGQEVRDS